MVLNNGYFVNNTPPFSDSHKTVCDFVRFGEVGLNIEKLLWSASKQNFAVKAYFRRNEKDEPQSTRGP
jgi:hypothetical protein